MTVHCVFYISSDGFTYSCDTLLGIFLEKWEAERALLMHVDAVRTFNEQCIKRDKQFTALVKAGKLKEAGGLPLVDFAGIADDDMDHYDIREVTVGEFNG